MQNDRPARLAHSQDGLITRSQALSAGMTRSALSHALRPQGAWRRILAGVYATFSGPLAEIHQLRAATLYVAGGVVTGAGACAMHGLRYGPIEDGIVGDVVEVVVDHRRRPRSTAFVRVRRTTRVPKPVWWVDEAVAGDVRGLMSWTRHDDDHGWAPSPGVIAVVPVARAVVDTVSRLELLPPWWSPTYHDGGASGTCAGGEAHSDSALRHVRALMCEAVQRRRCSLTSLAAEVTAAPVRGGRLARQALSDIVAGCRSAPECEVRDLIRSSRFLPEPRYNRPLPGARGIVPDAAWDEARLVLEVDSRSFHGFGDAPARTEQRRARLAALGWRVLPVSPTRLRCDRDAVLREIEQAFRAGVAA